VQANDRPLYIFDLDGTLALIDHRRPLVEAPYIFVGDAANTHSIHDPNHPRKYKTIDGMVYQQDPNFKPDWSAFYDACHLDVPNMPVVRTFNQLYTIGAELMIWSGREDSVQDKSMAVACPEHSRPYARANAQDAPNRRLHARRAA